MLSDGCPHDLTPPSHVSSQRVSPGTCCTDWWNSSDARLLTRCRSAGRLGASSRWGSTQPGRLEAAEVGGCKATL